MEIPTTLTATSRPQTPSTIRDPTTAVTTDARPKSITSPKLVHDPG